MPADFSFYCNPAPDDRQRLYVASIGGQSWRRDSSLIRRGHRYHLLMCTTGGLASGKVNGDPLYAELNSIWIFPRNKTYTYTWDPEHRHWSYVWIEFDGNWAASTLEMMNLHRQHQFHQCHKARPLIDDFISTLRKGQNQVLHQCLAKLLDIFASMERSLIDPERSAGSSSLDTIIKKYMADHLSDPIQLDDIAKHVQLSPFHLSRVFKQDNQMSPMRYLRQLRLDRARSLFRRGDLNISEIGQAVGYPVVQHFSRMFKSETGMSPRQYLKELH